MPYSVFSFPLKPNQATLVTSLVHVYTTASSPTTTVSTLALTGNGTLDLSAPTHVLSLYPRIPLMNSTDIPSHKIPTAEFSPGRTVQVLGRLLLLGPGMDASEYLIGTSDQ